MSTPGIHLSSTHRRSRITRFVHLAWSITDLQQGQTDLVLRFWTGQMDAMSTEIWLANLLETKELRAWYVKLSAEEKYDAYYHLSFEHADKFRVPEQPKWVKEWSQSRTCHLSSYRSHASTDLIPLCVCASVAIIDSGYADVLLRAPDPWSHLQVFIVICGFIYRQKTIERGTAHEDESRLVDDAANRYELWFPDFYQRNFDPKKRHKRFGRIENPWGGGDPVSETFKADCDMRARYQKSR